jgi:hypothetical protein
MDFKKFANDLNLENKVLSIIQTDENHETNIISKAGCLMRDVETLEPGKTLILVPNEIVCRRGAVGIGYNDDLPLIPGSFGHFISDGAGEGYPKGEKIKNCPETGERMINDQPKNVRNGKKYILVKHYEEKDNPTTVTIKVNMDQLSVLAFLFNFEKSEYNNIYVGIVSGCGSVFRLPFDEANKNSGKVVIGNLDMVSRLRTNKDEAYFTVSGEEFKKILENADESFLETIPGTAIKLRINR